MKTANIKFTIKEQYKALENLLWDLRSEKIDSIMVKGINEFDLKRVLKGEYVTNNSVIHDAFDLHTLWWDEQDLETPYVPCRIERSKALKEYLKSHPGIYEE